MLLCLIPVLAMLLCLIPVLEPLLDVDKRISTQVQKMLNCVFPGLTLNPKNNTELIFNFGFLCMMFMLISVRNYVYVRVCTIVLVILIIHPKIKSGTIRQYFFLTAH